MMNTPKNLGGATGRVYQYLLDEIISNRLKPGAALSEVEIATRLESSRTPVREAMMILESEGIVIRYPSRGCFVAQVTVRDVEEIFELRTLFEVCALRSSYSRIDDEHLAELEQKLEDLTPNTAPEDYFETDRQLHNLLLTYCGNGRLVNFLNILNAQIERVRHISSRTPSRLATSRREHLEIVRSLRRRDLSLAEQLLTRHIGNVRDSTKEVCKYMNTHIAP